MKKKYKYTGETKVVGRVKLHQIVSLRDFGDVKKGDIGGWIEKYSNLSHEGDCWVYDNAMVFGNAKIIDNARVGGNAKVGDNALVFDDALVGGNTWVYDNARVGDNAFVGGNALVSDNARVKGNAMVSGNACVYNNARVGDDAMVYGIARVYGDARVYGVARIYGDTLVYGNARVYGDANICLKKDIITIDNIGSRIDTTTAFRTSNGSIDITCGCFKGTLDEFKEAVKKTHGDNEYGREYKLFIDLIKVHFGVKEERDD